MIHGRPHDRQPSIRRRTRRPARGLALGFIALTAAFASAAGPTTNEHDALKALVPIYEQAVRDSKPDLLKPILDPQFSGVMLTGDPLDDPTALDAYWSKIQGLLGADGKYQVKVHVSAPALIENDLAIASGTTDDIVDAKGQHYEFTSQWTAVCRKSGDQWKLLRIQATIDPIYNPFVKTAIRRTLVTACIVAGVVGLTLGVVLGAIVWRRRRPARTPA